MQTYKKIRIVGSVGSGKTTLARFLSEQLSIPFYELDNVVWNRTENGDVRHTEEERDAILQSITDSENWIVEGVHNDDWVTTSFEKADIVIILNIHQLIRDIRITRRFIRQKLGIEKSNYKPTMKIFFKMFKWNRHFEEEYPAIMKKLQPYKEKLIVIEKNKQLQEFFK